MPRLETDQPSWSSRIQSLPRDVLHRYHRLGRKGKTAVWGVTALHLLALALVVIITPTRIGGWFNTFAQHLKGLGAGGVAICFLMVVLASHPPLFGFMGSMTLIGFIYGMWPGAMIAVLASMSGSAFAFLSIRSFFLHWIRKYSNPKWEAFANVMRAKGLPLVIMIRYCPLPWAMGNGLFASIESVKFWHFMVANLMIQPRLLIPVFIGSRLTSLTSETPGHDPLRFWLNIGSIALSASISVLTGVWIYRLTLDQMRKLEKSREGELAAEALEEGALFGEYRDSDDEENEDEPLTERSQMLRPERGALRRVSSSGEDE
ncbi:hypothetical protein BCR39DRAFT_533830 [Naematelia encephala]|uniref:Golgi apparatus membrane protein TVP38 n=1 Tax=Naematelia encephala TaxID=71784 RepID=A0A1Y2B2J7_9TREE|nr:hypothetical protein BCR39DRAFT_533830 [Naematelia encephala]